MSSKQSPFTVIDRMPFGRVLISRKGPESVMTSDCQVYPHLQATANCAVDHIIANLILKKARGSRGISRESIKSTSMDNEEEEELIVASTLSSDEEFNSDGNQSPKSGLNQIQEPNDDNISETSSSSESRGSNSGPESGQSPGRCSVEDVEEVERQLPNKVADFPKYVFIQTSRRSNLYRLHRSFAPVSQSTHQAIRSAPENPIPDDMVRETRVITCSLPKSVAVYPSDLSEEKQEDTSSVVLINPTVVNQRPPVEASCRRVSLSNETALSSDQMDVNVNPFSSRVSLSYGLVVVPKTKFTPTKPLLSTVQMCLPSTPTPVASSKAVPIDWSAIPLTRLKYSEMSIKKATPVIAASEKTLKERSITITPKQVTQKSDRYLAEMQIINRNAIIASIKREREKERKDNFTCGECRRKFMPATIRQQRKDSPTVLSATDQMGEQRIQITSGSDSEHAERSNPVQVNLKGYSRHFTPRNYAITPAASHPHLQHWCHGNKNVHPSASQTVVSSHKSIIIAPKTKCTPTKPLLRWQPCPAIAGKRNVDHNMSRTPLFGFSTIESSTGKRRETELSVHKLTEKQIINKNPAKKIPGKELKKRKKTDMFKCRKCMKTFKTAEKRLIHELRHRLQTYDCARKLRSKYIYNLKAHVKVKLKDLEPKLKCSMCGKSNLTDAQLRVHSRKHVTPKNECKYCGKMFFVQKALQFHVNNVHKPQETLQSISRPKFLMDSK